MQKDSGKYLVPFKDYLMFFYYYMIPLLPAGWVTLGKSLEIVGFKFLLFRNHSGLAGLLATREIVHNETSCLAGTG